MPSSTLEEPKHESTGYPLSIHPPRAATTILILLLAALPLATYPDAATGSATGSDSTEMNELLPGRAESIRVPLLTETAAQPRDDAPNDRAQKTKATAPCCLTPPIVTSPWGKLLVVILAYLLTWQSTNWLVPFIARDPGVFRVQLPGKD